MSNAVVILLWLCIGVALGFIVPSGDTKINLSNNTTLSNIKKKGIKEIKALPITTTIKSRQASELPINRTQIDENDLYEHATATENVQNERALIYINQKYRKPSIHQFFRLIQNGQEISRRFYDPPIMPQDVIQRLNKPCAVKTSDKEKTINKSNGQLNYNEVHSPSVISRKNMISKIQYDRMPTTSTTNYKDFVKQFRKLYKESNIVKEKHKDMWKNFGFQIPNTNAGYYANTVLNKVETPKNFEENRLSKNNALRVPEKAVDYYKLVRKYNDMHNIKTVQNITNTNYLSPCDCSRKPSLKFGYSTEAYRQKICKCIRNLKITSNCLKANERHDSHEMNTILSPSDMSFYKDFLSQRL